MRRFLIVCVLLLAGAAVCVVAASTLTLSNPGSPLAGSNAGSSCDVGSVYFHPVSTAPGSDVWVFWRIETSAFDEQACADSELRAKVAWDGPDDGDEPDGYYYMRIPTDQDLNKPSVVGATILGVFADAQDDICDPFNCYPVDSEGQDIVRYIYSAPTFDDAHKIAATPDVATHQLGETDWIITATDAPLQDF